MNKMGSMSKMGSVGGTVRSFNSTGKGKQIFDNATIRCGGYRKRGGGYVPFTEGTVDSFNREGDGLQSFRGANIQSGEGNEKEEDGTEELWAELEKIGVEDDSLLHVYLFLHNNPSALKAFNGVPIHQRKQFLAKTVPNYAPQGSVRNVKI
ncbi:hypothetical protein VNO80_29383 [Phaseolus coccineus]|uniref:Uncharacterized protein n=1 Tax=Phaseolus coccineus TaxID=3886 RepID=A0AAN9QIF6_PHACN